MCDEFKMQQEIVEVETSKLKAFMRELMNPIVSLIYSLRKHHQ
jgi:hypothetical protein